VSKTGQCDTHGRRRISGMALPASPTRAAAACLAALLLAACAPLPPQPGAPAAEVRRSWGAPTGEHALPGGGTRLEYASGPYGRTTWMVDLGSDGRVLRARQVLSPETLLGLPAGQLDRAGLRRELGRPGEVQGVRGGGETWYWRYETNDCLWLAASISPEGLFIGGAVLSDPTCDARSDGFD
jgi:hypothetical protein